MSFFENYLELFEDEQYRNAIIGTAERFDKQVFEEFRFNSFKQCLMYGDVQSGKTSHVLGVVGKALDRGFKNVVILTSDNTRLAQQTFDRVFEAFPDAEVCSKDDETRFRRAIQRDLKRRNLSKPVIVVLTKNVTMLQKWKQLFKITGTLHGKPLLIVDDEADAASLNAKVNSGDITPVNRELTEMREQSGIGIYLQVTGTPQAILLQAKIDQWRPDHYLAFSPGSGYIGGKQLFDEIPNPYLRTFSDDPLSEELEFARAVETFLITSALMDRAGRQACNMLVHPSRQKADHEGAKTDVLSLIERVRKNFAAPEVTDRLAAIWEQDLARTVGLELDKEEVVMITRDFLQTNEIDCRIVNSEHAVEDVDELESGFNVVIGGDSLGRGLTIPALQTIYYSRTTKSPQADTLWQHARMFGYDRLLSYLRVSMPADTAKAFQQVHDGNEAIKAQFDNGVELEAINIELDPRIKPTRSTVINRDKLRTIVGGVNFFASDPENLDFDTLDGTLRTLSSPDPVYVDLRIMRELMGHFNADPDDFPVKHFLTILDEMAAANPGDVGVLFIRFGRKVRQGTGSLLSPNDRREGDAITDEPVLTVYRIEEELGWQSAPIWVPNFKLPGGNIYYRVTD